MIDKRIKDISERIYRRSKYFECLVEHREEGLQAMFDHDLCAIWKIFDECNVPCEDRWDAVEYIMEQAKNKEGPHFW